MTDGISDLYAREDISKRFDADVMANKPAPFVAPTAIPADDFRTVIVNHPIVPSTGTLTGGPSPERAMSPRAAVVQRLELMALLDQTTAVHDQVTMISASLNVIEKRLRDMLTLEG